MSNLWFWAYIALVLFIAGPLMTLMFKITTRRRDRAARRERNRR